MALTEVLSIYRSMYKLLLALIDARNNFDKSFKYVVSERMVNTALDCVSLIHFANEDRRNGRPNKRYECGARPGTVSRPVAGASYMKAVSGLRPRSLSMPVHRAVSLLPLSEQAATPCGRALSALVRHPLHRAPSLFAWTVHSSHRFHS